MREVITTSILLGFDQKNRFFEEWSWFKFNNLGLAIGANLKFTQVGKRVKTKFKKVFRANFDICGSHRGNTGRGVAFLSPHFE